MNLSGPFVRRPVGTTLLTLGVALTGLAAFFVLPIAPLPQVDFPTVSVTAGLPGASPSTMASSVASPLEKKLGVIAGVTEMTSQSGTGSTRVTLQFDLSRDIDGAARDVQAAINAARADLPATLRTNPTYRKANPADAPIMILALTSETRSPASIYDAVSNVIQQRLLQVDGVGDVELGGAALPAVRIDLNPLALARFGIALEDVRSAISSASAHRPRGVIENDALAWQIEGSEPGLHASDYRDLLIAWRGEAAVRLSDVATVYDGPEDVRTMGLFNGVRAVTVIISRQPGANIVATVDAVKAQLPALEAVLPKDIKLQVASDRTTTIRASLHEVEVTLIIATLLVVVVTSVFLQSLRATLVPAVAVVVSLLGTLGVMYALGFSLNNLSLMALTIATGFVVDDAIVVLENISRHVERGMPARQAALLGAREVGFTVVSISISLVAVFIPLLFMGGIIGRLFREFAVTLSVAVLISLVISLTTTPMLVSLLLRGREKPNRFSALAAGAFDRLQQRYSHGLDWALNNRPTVLVILAGVVVLNLLLMAAVPKGFFPEQDTGSLQGGMRADQSISFQEMQRKITQVAGIIRGDPDVDTVVAFTGGSRAGGGFMFVILKPRDQRASSREIIGRLRPKLAGVSGLAVFLNPVQDMQIGGRGASSTYQFTLKADDVDTLQKAGDTLVRLLKQEPQLVDVDIDRQQGGAEVLVQIDRDRAAQLGIPTQAVDAALYDAFGQRQVATIYSGLNQYHVVMGVAPEFNGSPTMLEHVYVPTTSASAATAGSTPVSATGTGRDASTGAAVSLTPANIVPLSTIVRWSTDSTAALVNHQDGQPSATVSFNLANNVSLGQATQRIVEVKQGAGLPSTVTGAFAGTARVFAQSTATIPLLILASLIVIYIVLGMLYESAIHPLTVLSTLPSAGVGAMLALLIGQLNLDLIALIGLILLIGIVKKNAIMIIDFALEAERSRGLSPMEAIREASLLRFRPILMTTLAAGFGAVPLAIGFGDGAELRRPLGIVIVGGLIASQLLTLLTTPVVYLALDRFRRPSSRTIDSALWSGTDMRIAILIVCVASCVACSVAPTYRRPSVEIPASFKEAPGWREAMPSDAVARGEWWQLFGDPVLSDLQRQVVLSNQNLAASKAAYDQSRALVRELRASLLPVISLTASGTEVGSFGRGNPTVGSTGSVSTGGSSRYSVTIGTTWEPDLWGRIGDSVRQAGALAQASEADLANATLSAQGELALNYIQLRGLQAQEEVLTATIAAYERALTITTNRYNAGVAARSDVLQAETALRNARANVADLGRQRALLEHAIAVLVGANPSNFTLPSGEWSRDVPEIPGVLPASLLERRPDIAAAERRVAAANSAIGIERSAYFPTFQLSGDAGYSSRAMSDLFESASSIWSLGLTGALTLLDFGARSARVDQARAAYEQTVAEYRQTVLTAFQQAEDQLAALRVLEVVTTERDAAAVAAKSAEKIAYNQYFAGQIGYADVIVAQTAALSSRQAEIQAVVDRQSAAVSLIQAIGGHWQ